MHKYENIDRQEFLNNIIKYINICENSKDWEDIFWISIYMYQYADEGSIRDQDIFKSLEKTFLLGLNVNSDKEKFLQALRILNNLCFKLERHDEVINNIQLYLDHVEEVPGWVHCNYAFAQISTDSIYRIAHNPSLFFRRLDRITDEEYVDRRNSVFNQLFLYLIKKYEYGEIEGLDCKIFIEKAISFGIVRSYALLDFKDTFCPDYEIPGVSKKAKLYNPKVSTYIEDDIIQLIDSLKSGRRKNKIVVLGDERLNKDEMMKVSEEEFHLGRDRIDYKLGYNEAKMQIDNQTYENYSCIIVGPIPHKVKGFDNFINEMEKRKHPHLIKATVGNNVLKLTKTSIRRSLSEATDYLNAIG